MNIYSSPKNCKTWKKIKNLPQLRKRPYRIIDQQNDVTTYSKTKKKLNKLEAMSWQTFERVSSSRVRPVILFYWSSYSIQNEPTNHSLCFFRIFVLYQAAKIQAVFFRKEGTLFKASNKIKTDLIMNNTTKVKSNNFYILNLKIANSKCNLQI